MPDRPSSWPGGPPGTADGDHRLRSASGAVRGVSVGHVAWASIQRRVGAVRCRARPARRAPSTSTSACARVAAVVIISAGLPASSSTVADTPRRHTSSRALARTGLSKRVNQPAWDRSHRRQPPNLVIHRRGDMHDPQRRAPRPRQVCRQHRRVLRRPRPTGGDHHQRPTPAHARPLRTSRSEIQARDTQRGRVGGPFDHA